MPGWLAGWLYTYIYISGYLLTSLTFFGFLCWCAGGKTINVCRLLDLTAATRATASEGLNHTYFLCAPVPVVPELPPK